MKLKTRKKIVNVLAFGVGACEGIAVGTVIGAAAKTLTSNPVLATVLYVGGSIGALIGINHSGVNEKIVDRIYDWVYKDENKE
jgi:hypothetical protein